MDKNMVAYFLDHSANIENSFISERDMNVGYASDVSDACNCLMMQDNEADAGWQSVCLSAHQEPAFNYAADFHVNDAVNKIIIVDHIHSPTWCSRSALWK